MGGIKERTGGGGGGGSEGDGRRGHIPSYSIAGVVWPVIMSIFISFQSTHSNVHHYIMFPKLSDLSTLITEQPGCMRT